MSQKHDLELAEKLEKLGDDTLVDASALGALLCLTPASARQAAYRNEDFPPRFPTPSRHLRWRLGDVREWIRRRAMLKDTREPAIFEHKKPPQTLIKQLDTKPKKPGTSRKAVQFKLLQLAEKNKKEGMRNEST